MAPADGLTQPTVAPQTTEAPHPWDVIVQWRQWDLRTVAATDIALGRNPFLPVATDKAQTSVTSQRGKDQTEENQRAALLTPEQLGLSLTGTILGRHRRVALINGEAYQEGETVVANKDSHEVAFRLVEIGRQGVVLEHSGLTFELVLPEVKNVGRIQPLRNHEQR